jgi:PAS domain S-box-containing protein
MGRQISKHKRRSAEEDEETVREDYVQKMRDTYPLILRTLMHDIIVSIDKDGNFVFVNDVAVEFLGESSEKLIGANFTEYLHPEDVGKAMGILQELMGSKDMAKDFIIRVKSPPGFRTLAMNGIAVFDDEGNYIGAHATGRDLTDLLRTEEELKWSQRHFQRLFEVMVDPVVIVDMNGNILEFSQSAEEILGLPREELVGKHFMEIDAATDKSKALMLKNLEKTKKGKYIPPYTIEAVTKDGKKLLYELTPAKLMYKGEPAILGIFHNITEQKKAEERLRASEERFKYFLENAPEAIWVQDFDGVFIDGNKRAEELTGYKREELIGKNMLEMDLIPSEYVPIAVEMFNPDKLGEISGPNELELIRKDGSLVSVEASIIPVEREGKLNIIGVARDITERKQAEKELIRLSSAVRISNDSIVISDLDGTIIDVNEATLKMYGSEDKSNLIGTNAFDLIVPEEREKALAGMKELLETGYLPNREYNVLTKHGSRIPVEMSTAIMKDADGKAIGFVSISRDITERKKAEDALKESEEKYRAIINAMNDTAWVIDFDGKFLDVNEAAVNVMGYSREELLSMGPTDIDNALTPEQIINLVKGMKSDKVQNFETAHTTKDGKTFPVEISSSLVTYHGKPAILSIARDITDRKKQEQMLRKAREKFETYFDLANVILVAIDAKGNVIQINKKGCEVLGYKKKEIVGKNWFNNFLPEKLGKKTKAYFRKLLSEQIEPVEYYENTVLTKDGKERLIAWHNILLRDKRGNIKGTLSSGEDITERKEVEDALSRERKMLETVTSNVNAALVVISKDYRILWANKVIKGFLGEIEGKPCYSVLTRQNNICPNCGMKEIVETGRDMVIHEHEVDSLIGKLWLEITTTAIRDEKGELTAVSEMSVDITERKKTENALKESEEKFRTIFEGATDGIAALDPKTMKVIFTNHKMTEITGYTPVELQNATIIDFVPKDEISSVIQQFQNHTGGKRDLTRYIPVIRKGKTQIYCDVRSKFLDIGNQQYLMAFVRDVTEQKKAEEALRESERQFRELTELLPSVVFEADASGTLTLVNNVAFDLFGYSQQDFDKGLNVFQMLVPEEKNRAKKNMGNILGGKTVGPVEYTALKKDGSTFPILIHASPITHGDKVAGFRGIVLDITERKKMENALRESEKSYRALINAMNDTVWVIGFDGKFIDVNDAAVNVLGYSREELLTMGPCDIDVHLSEEDIKGLIKQLPDEGMQVFETVHFTKDGKAIPVEISSSLATYKGKQVILSIARDITERKKAQEEIKEANRLLKQSNEELENYTYAVSHDLKAPLRTIKSFGSFLLEDYKNKLDETGQDYLNRMVKASSHMDAMIEDLLVLSRVGRQFTEIEKVDLNKLLKEILADLEATIKERNAEVVVDRLPTLSVHRVWKRQLFMNLISNALKFNESKKPKIEVLYEERENDHLFKVRDNGIGIEEKYLDRIFNLFERAPTEKKYEGTGAGLAICKKIVEQHGGKIWVESTHGKGSTFLFTIPKEAKQAEEA